MNKERLKWFGFIALALPTLMLSIDTSVMYLALPRLATDLKASSMQQLWIMDVYGFMMAGFLITMGNLGDRLGYRRLLRIASACFGLASVLAAFAGNVHILIIARAFMGIAGAAIMPSVLALIRNMFTDQKQRSTAISLWMSCFMAGMILGPLLGGFVLEHFHWGAVFLISVPVMILVMLTPKALLPEFSQTNNRLLDLMSALYSLACVLSIIYGMTEPSLPAIFAGTLFGIAFAFRQHKKRGKLIDFRLFENRNFRVTFIAMFVTAVLMGGVAFLVAQFLQMVLGLSAFDAGLWMIPQAAGMILGSIFSPVIASGIGRRKTISAGLFISAMGMGIICCMQAIQGLAWVETGFVMSVMGAAPILVLGTGIIIGSAAAENAGAAASISETGNQLGVAIGVAILGGLASHIYRTGIGENIPVGLSAENWNRSRESLATATAVATKLAGACGKFLLGKAKCSFIQGMRAIAAGGVISFSLLSYMTAKKYTT